ncbi:MAG: phosphoethanolamine transferase [Puniceicoccales bacterium]|jgi:glucan phosphoethanolaminetransferase (alkaline phosphatase superfamily)|nr:phosphoethanolamine transferase [Puniceicoccales bacterium]
MPKRKKLAQAGKGPHAGEQSGSPNTIPSGKIALSPSSQAALLSCVFLCLCLFPALFPGLKTNVRIPVFLSGLGFWSLVLLCWHTCLTRAFSILLLLAWCTNITTSTLFYFEYATAFNETTAQNVLFTNSREVKGVFSSLWGYFLSGAALFVLLLLFLHKWTKKMGEKMCRFSKFGTCAFLIYLLAIPIIYLTNGKSKTIGFSMPATTLLRTPLYNAARLISALSATRNLEELKPVKYNLGKQETGLDVHIIVLGESARKNNLSLYGYSRKTSPFADEERKNMLLFANAIAPAPMTIMALALSLSRYDKKGKMPPNIGDNILNMANQAGLHTVWIDRNPVSQNDALSLIARFAKETIVAKVPNDEGLLPHVEKALANPAGKKLIVIHVDGSHSPYAPTQYPEGGGKFSGGSSEDLDNYDNSIYATDVFLGKIFQLLRGRKASLLYYSDHALMRKTIFGRSRFRHGNADFPREAVDVPMFIWYAPSVTAGRKLGLVKAPYSTGDNYYLVRDWLGLVVYPGTPGEGSASGSPLREGYVPRESIIILNTEQRLMRYSSLQREAP